MFSVLREGLLEVYAQVHLERMHVNFPDINILWPASFKC